MRVAIVLLAVFAAIAEIGNAGEAVRISPEGHLKEFLSRQISGLTGNRGAMGYPFDGCMWAGSISNVYFEEDLPYSRKVAAPRDEIWWPYEQAAYLLDGMMRLSRLVDAPELRSDFKRNLDWCIDHQAPDGDLFAAYSKSTCQWPMVVFFRAALAYVESVDAASCRVSSNEAARVKEAFIRHYASKRNAPQGTDDRDVLNVEGMLKVAEWTGDRSYVTAAEDWFRRHIYCERFANTDRVHSHGVTFCEMMKLPMLLYKATGKEVWRKLGIKAIRDVFRHNETPNGQVSACEYLSGRDPWEGSETCDAADMICALSHFLNDPEAGCEAADHMERIAYNALPGATTKDFTAHQYISLPNQAVATPFSHGGHFFYGEPDWNRFRVCHFAQCCSGNINRAMPLFVENCWREAKAKNEGEGRGVVSMLLGPGSVKGDGYEIVCETDYPFGDKLTYRFKITGDDGRVRTPAAPGVFAFRIPSWVAAATVAKNGTPMNLAVKPGTLAKVADTWRDGDTLEVVFDQPVTFHSDRHWHWLRRGALTLAHPVKTRCIRENPNAKFSDLSFEDPEPFNYAFDLEQMRQSNNQTIRTIKQSSPYPFETPNLVVRVPMREIREWQGLSEQRFTPPVPLYTHETGRTVTLDFVPYATTLTRITAFPDTEKRTALPVVRVYAAPECYDYDPKKPLAEQRGEPECWTDEEFCDKGVDVQRSPDLWTDCEAQYLANKGKFAYLLFRFWSDREGPVTCALGASRCVQAFVGGKEVYANGPIVEGRMVAPFWFALNAKNGYNFLKVKVATNGKEKVFGQDQYRREWGAKLDVFKVETKGKP